MKRVRTFSDVGPGQAAMIVDSAGWLAAAVNGGSLAEALRVSAGDLVVVSRVG
jgi:S-adenosylmethionine hydrolase